MYYYLKAGAECGFVRNRAPPSLSRDRKIKMEQTTNKGRYLPVAMNVWWDSYACNKLSRQAGWYALYRGTKSLAYYFL